MTGPPLCQIVRGGGEGDALKAGPILNPTNPKPSRVWGCLGLPEGLWNPDGASCSEHFLADISEDWNGEVLRAQVFEAKNWKPRPTLVVRPTCTTFMFRRSSYTALFTSSVEGGSGN